MLEWACFQKYTQRIQKLRGYLIPNALSSEVFFVLQHCATNKHLFPNTKSVNLWPNERTVSFIPLLLSLRTTIINILHFGSNSPTRMVTLVIATFPTLCPNLQKITLHSLPRDPMITAAVSGILLSSSQNTLWYFNMDSPLTEEACQVVYKLPNLHDLSVVIEKGSSLPSVALPNLTNLTIKYDHRNDWSWVFHGARFKKLRAITFHSGSEQVGGFLEAFERLTLPTSTQSTLSEFCLYTLQSWNPNYSSLLLFA